ncbi:uncharacterized protein LOC115585385 [Sparus aurata]|uniref:uncharacterized protein LOC115585385 n=1 Tax=Sparus aurata TaxID=8175 RepID=UPI0011C0D171|nr:uncharacterized protein LOC115585385 [Sparus aurata]
MDRSDTGQLNLRRPPVAEDNRRVNRGTEHRQPITLPAFVTSDLASVVSIFCFGVVSGAAGGLLLGATAVVLLQSLELLANHSTLIDELGQYLTDDYYFERRAKHILPWESQDQVHDIHVSIFAEMFGVFCSALSLPLGACVGLSMYSMEINRKGEAARGTALAVAGPVCLLAVTLTGGLLGFFFESFLSMTLIVSILLWFCIAVLPCLYPITLLVFTPAATLITFLLSFYSKIRLILVVIFIPAILEAKDRSIKLDVVTVPLMLTIYDLYNIAGQQIVSLPSPLSTDRNSVVVEAIFVGVLASLMLMVTVGTSLFVKWQRGGAGKICATAAATGSTALGVIRLGLPVLGPGPIIGALIGVAGAAGVSHAAAGAATERYRPQVQRYVWFGRLGVTVGAAVGAFAMSCSHSGLSAMFMALCAATVPAGAFLQSSTHYRGLYVFLWICMYTVLIIATHTALWSLWFMDKFTRDKIRPLFQHKEGFEFFSMIISRQHFSSLSNRSPSISSCLKTHMT